MDAKDQWKDSEPAAGKRSMRQVLERIEFAVIGVPVALGFAAMLYTMAGYLLQAWQWVTG